MTTTQVLQALSSYQKYVNGEKSYWDLTDKSDNVDKLGEDLGNGNENVSTGYKSIIVYLFILILSTLYLFVFFSRKYITRK